jgi:hypothetical protein
MAVPIRENAWLVHKTKNFLISDASAIHKKKGLFDAPLIENQCKPEF